MKKFSYVLILCITFLSFSVNAFADEKESVVNIGKEYGSIYGSERNPAEGDNSKWLTIGSGDTGVRIVSKDGKEIVAVDNYGGIYLDGDVYIANKKVDPNASYKANGFMYLLITISLVCNGYLLISRKKNSKA